MQKKFLMFQSLRDISLHLFRFKIAVSSPRPGAKNVEEHLEELQHDLALIGQIAGLVASLRKSYDVSFIFKIPGASKRVRSLKIPST